MRPSSSIGRDSSVGRSEGPRFEPGSRHFLACSLHVLSGARICCSFCFAPILLQVSHVTFFAENDTNLVPLPAPGQHWSCRINLQWPGEWMSVRGLLGYALLNLVVAQFGRVV